MLFNILGLLVIVFIVWWFWLAKPRAGAAIENGVVEVIVENGVYTPSVIQVSRGQPLTLRFLRRDPSPCAEKVIFSNLNINADLPINEPKDIQLNVDTPDSYEFTCQMGMYRGKLLVQ
jgi:plastocyanin domain-containing protein